MILQRLHLSAWTPKFWI